MNDKPIYSDKYLGSQLVILLGGEHCPECHSMNVTIRGYETNRRIDCHDCHICWWITRD